MSARPEEPNSADPLNNPSLSAREGDLVQLVSPSNKTTLIRLKGGDVLQSHRGVLAHDDLIGQPWGSQVRTHTGSYYYLLQPALHDILKETRRNTQIMYPKDIGFILVKMGIGPGSQVVEAGTGSGALAVALAWAVGPTGRVISYEIRPEMQSLARKNLERAGLLERVTLKLRDIAEGFDENGMQALFLDLPNPYDYLEQSHRLLRAGGQFGTILPTTNQVSRLLSAFRQQPFGFVEVCEIMLRFYKAVADRLRPTDRMVAHTGYLVFARAMQHEAPETVFEPEE